MQRAYFKVGRDELVQMSRQGDEEAAAELIARGRDPQTGLKTSGLGARIGKAVKNPRPKRSRIRKKHWKAVNRAMLDLEGPEDKFHLHNELQALYADVNRLRHDYNNDRISKQEFDSIEFSIMGQIDHLEGILGHWGGAPYKRTKRKKAKKNPRALSNGAPRLGKKYIGKYDNLCPYSGKPMLGHEVCKPFYPKGPYGRADVLEQMSAEDIKAALEDRVAEGVKRGVEKRRGKAGQMLGGQQGMRLPLALPKSMSKRERTKYDAALLPRFQNVGPEPYDEVDILRLLSRGDRDGQMTTVRFFERMLERQLSDERSGRRTRHLNQIGFNKFDAPVAEAIYEEYQSSGMTPEINAMMAEMLVKYRGQLAAIASVGAQRTGRGIRTNPVDGRRERVRRRRAGKEEIAAAMMEMRGESYRRKPSEGRRHGSRGTAQTRDEMVSLYFEAYDRSPEDQTILREMGFPYPEEVEANKGIRKGHIQALLTDMEEVQLPSDFYSARNNPDLKTNPLPHGPYTYSSDGAHMCGYFDQCPDGSSYYFYTVRGRETDAEDGMLATVTKVRDGWQVKISPQLVLPQDPSNTYTQVLRERPTPYDIQEIIDRVVSSTTKEIPGYWKIIQIRPSARNKSVARLGQYL